MGRTDELEGVGGVARLTAAFADETQGSIGRASAASGNVCPVRQRHVGNVRGRRTRTGGQLAGCASAPRPALRLGRRYRPVPTTRVRRRQRPVGGGNTVYRLGRSLPRRSRRRRQPVRGARSRRSDGG